MFESQATVMLVTQSLWWFVDFGDEFPSKLNLLTDGAQRSCKKIVKASDSYFIVVINTFRLDSNIRHQHNLCYINLTSRTAKSFTKTIKFWPLVFFNVFHLTIFALTVIIEDDCIKAKFCMICIHMNVMELILVIKCSKYTLEYN